MATIVKCSEHPAELRQLASPLATPYTEFAAIHELDAGNDAAERACLPRQPGLKPVTSFANSIL
jgi:hypothetical protein